MPDFSNNSATPLTYNIKNAKRQRMPMPVHRKDGKHWQPLPLDILVGFMQQQAGF
jgi:hypothetical protein